MASSLSPLISYALDKIVSNGIEDSDFELTKYYKHLKGDFDKISPKTRKVKKGANILGIDYYEILSNSYLKLFSQGKNSNGNPRNPKYLIPKELQPTISIRKTAPGQSPSMPKSSRCSAPKPLLPKKKPSTGITGACLKMRWC